MAATDIRPKITLACQECKHRNYITRKNRRNDPDRLELSKYCPFCRKRTSRTARRASVRPADPRPPPGQRPGCPLTAVFMLE